MDFQELKLTVTRNRNRAEDEVQNRIRILEDGLESSKFDAEAENIRAAIAGYRSGNIPFSRQYTIIWAGQIVDTFDNYQAFTTNRTELLDRYENDYGYGWLWWESPLDIRGDERPQMQRCTELLRENTASGMGQYKVNQGFWKRFGWVARLPFTPEVFESVPVGIYSPSSGLLTWNIVLTSYAGCPCRFLQE